MSETSGAADRRRKRKKEEAERQREVNENDDGIWAGEFKEAGTPDLENAGTDLDYVRKLQLIALRQMATTPFPTLKQENLWRRIREMSAVVGMTSNRSQLESRTKKLEKQLANTQQGGGVRIEAGARVKRSPNARGQKTAPKLAPPEETEPKI